MITPDFTVKRDDVGKVYAGILKDAAGAAVNVTGFTSAKLYWVNLLTNVVKINGATITIPTPSTGAWTYTFIAADLDTSGYFKQEIQIFFGATRMTFPTDNDAPFTIVKVQDDLG